MNWPIRYAVTKKSLSQLQSVLPEGWQVQGFGQPNEHLWERDTPRNFSTPDAVTVHNPTTGNRMFLLDHSKLSATNPDEFWNPLHHGDYIHAFATHLDRLGSGISLHLARNTRNKEYYQQDKPDEYGGHGDIAVGWHHNDKAKDNFIDANHPLYLNKPSLMNSGLALPEMNDYLRRGRNVHKCLQTITHEYGHRLEGRYLLANNFFTNNDPRVESMAKDHFARMRGKSGDSQEIRDVTSPTWYGARNWNEFYAEHYTNYKHNLQGANSSLSTALAERLRWGEPIR
jgi:hypothetical protein